MIMHPARRLLIIVLSGLASVCFLTALFLAFYHLATATIVSGLIGLACLHLAWQVWPRFNRW